MYNYTLLFTHESKPYFFVIGSIKYLFRGGKIVKVKYIINIIITIISDILFNHNDVLQLLNKIHFSKEIIKHVT